MILFLTTIDQSLLLSCKLVQTAKDMLGVLLFCFVLFKDGEQGLSEVWGGTMGRKGGAGGVVGGGGGVGSEEDG